MIETRTLYALTVDGARRYTGMSGGWQRNAGRTLYAWLTSPKEDCHRSSTPPERAGICSCASCLRRNAESIILAASLISTSYKSKSTELFMDRYVRALVKLMV